MCALALTGVPADSEVDATPLHLHLRVGDRLGYFGDTISRLAFHSIEVGVSKCAHGVFQQQLETSLCFVLAFQQVDELTCEFLCGLCAEVRL